MDYKTTLNLPQTGFPMKADLIAREPQRLQKWESAKLYQSIQQQRATAEKFVLHDGPPFANGDVHVGTALNKILKDIIVKYQTSRGKNAPYVPGWDCHGLPIEFKVTQEMRKAGEKASDAATVRKACDAYARKFIDIQRTQFKRLGVLGDWENPYLTLNKEYEADELRLFADIVEKGFVYRGKKPVYWSIPARTALAEAEVEYHDHVSQSIYVKFPVVGEPNTFVLIWTTTPWTLPANLAVAYNSTLEYFLVQVGEEKYWVLSQLLSTVAEKAKWDDHKVIRKAPGSELASLQYQHPFCNRTGKLFAGDNFVESSTGTGFVHIAPGHGLDDYNVGRQNNLPIYSPVDDDGALAYTSDLSREQQMPPEMVGKSILEKHGKSDANEAVLHELRVRHALLHQENYHHSYPFCWRSKTPIIFRAMDQWFVAIDHKSQGKTFRQLALEEIDRVKWIPEWGVNRIKGAVEGRPDWCISRQRTWGVPIPAFYDAQGNPSLDADIVRNTAKLIEQHGSTVWFEKSVAELWSLVKPANWKGADPIAKSNDTLDVWIDSGSSSRAVLMRRPELQHPSAKDAQNWQADVYLEGSDQHRGWFQSSLLLSLAGNGAAPFRTVL
ncbi:MAG: isoleucine--tRNA ligase, partial [Limisphaerales bacterium]